MFNQLVHNAQKRYISHFSGHAVRALPYLWRLNIIHFFTIHDSGYYIFQRQSTSVNCFNLHSVMFVFSVFIFVTFQFVYQQLMSWDSRILLYEGQDIVPRPFLIEAERYRRRIDMFIIGQRHVMLFHNCQLSFFGQLLFHGRHPLSRAPHHYYATAVLPDFRLRADMYTLQSHV